MAAECTPPLRTAFDRTPHLRTGVSSLWEHHIRPSQTPHEFLTLTTWLQSLCRPDSVHRGRATPCGAGRAPSAPTAPQRHFQETPQPGHPVSSLLWPSRAHLALSKTMVPSDLQKVQADRGGAEGHRGARSETSGAGPGEHVGQCVQARVQQNSTQCPSREKAAPKGPKRQNGDTALGTL